MEIEVSVFKEGAFCYGETKEAKTTSDLLLTAKQVERALKRGERAEISLLDNGLLLGGLKIKGRN